MTVSWQRDDDNLAGVTRWQQLRYKQHDSEDYTYIDLANTDTQTVINGLQPNTTYDVALNFKNSRGIYGWQGFTTDTTDVTTTSAAGSGAQSSNGGGSKKTGDQSGGYASSEAKVNLNDFVEFTQGEGKQLELKVGQVVYFTVNGEEHSATVKEVGVDYVVLTLASTPRDVHLIVGQVSQFDVTEDGMPDIQITLNSTRAGVATLTFKQIVSTTTQASTSKSSDAAVGRSTNWLFWLLAVVGVGVLMLLIAAKHRKDDGTKRTRSPN